MTAPWEFEFESLMKRLLDDRPSLADLQQLELLLAENPDALDAYARLIVLDTISRECLGPKPSDSAGPIAAACSAERRQDQLSDDLTNSADAKVDDRVKSPVLGFLGGVIDYASHSRMFMLWLIAGLLGLYFVFQLGSLLVSRFWAQNAAQLADDRGAGAEKHGSGSEQPGVPSGKVVATLTDAVDCQWEAADSRVSPRPPHLSPLALGTPFHASQKLTLVAGLAELTFDSGAKVILHGPARFSVADSMGGRLQVGKLTAKVPHAAAGFTIATPSGKVVDLGTEFGVKVNDDGKMDVIVYVGDVKVEGGAPGAGGAAADGSIHISAGHAISIGTDHVAKPVPPQDEHFVRDLAPLGESKKAEAAYVEFMKSLKPVVWFRMEGKETDRVLHDEMGGKDAKLSWDGPGNPFVKGPIGKGLWLRGEKLRDYAIVSDYPKAEHGKLTVAAWAYAESFPQYATIVGNWQEKTAAGQFTFEAGAVFLKQENGAPIFLRESAADPFPLYQWQHVAFTTDGSTLRLYRQGREVAKTAHLGLLKTTPIRALGIGVNFDTSNIAPGREYPGLWDGKLDEIAIFNDALSADDIRKLAGAAPR
jgi:hypothetical protein